MANSWHVQDKVPWPKLTRPYWLPDPSERGGAPVVVMEATKDGAMMPRPLPVTLYPGQWIKLLDKADDIRASIRANEASLTTKS